MTTDRMLQFVRTDKAMPEKRSAEDRRVDFDEIYAAFSEKKSKRAGFALFTMWRAFLSDQLSLAQ